jgi:hypothetical protein
MPANEAVAVVFTVSSPGSVYLRAFPPANIGTVRACLQHTEQSACAPTVFPNPAFWEISEPDLARHATYQLRVLAITRSQGVGLDVGWNGPHQLQASGLRLPGGCTPQTGYNASCGLRFRINSGPGDATMGASPGDLHFELMDKSSTTQPPYDEPLPGGPVTFTIPYQAAWSGYLYPETGQPVTGVSMTFSWP